MYPVLYYHSKPLLNLTDFLMPRSPAHATVSVPKQKSGEIMLRYWLFLLAAIVSEIAGTTSLKAFDTIHSGEVGMLATSVFIALSYYLLSKAVLRIPLGVAYTCWEGVGLALVATSSYLLFDEPMPPVKLLGIACVICGLLWLHHEMRHSDG
jgi:spermidine export protein MdtJ